MRVLVIVALLSAFLGADARNKACKEILPVGCTCSEKVIDCSNAGINTTEVFLNIPLSFPDLVSLNMTGNSFAYLEKDLFSLAGHQYQSLEKIDLSNCKIEGIHKHAFVGLPNLEELILSRNRISFRNHSTKTTEPGRDVRPTENFLPPIASSLKVLELADAFDRKERQELSANLIGNLSLMFNSTDLKVLQYLNLSNNHLPYLPPDMFCRTPLLEYLYLASNRFYTFTANEICLHSLMELQLQSNFIRRVDDHLMDLIDSRPFLKTVYLIDNPFTCDCETQKFIRWARASTKLADKGDLVCTRAKPRDYVNQALIAIPEDRLRCTTDGSEYLHGVYIVCAIAFLGLLALLLCIMYTNRGLLCRRTIRSWMPLGGYQSLGREPEVKAEMV